MSTSAKVSKTKKVSKAKKAYLHNAIGMLCCSLFLALFGAIYECFGHGVISYAMIFAFAIPLLGAVLPYLVGMAIGGRKHSLPPMVFHLWNSGLITLAVGSVFKGVLVIYGTTNSKLVLYWIFGGILLCAALICWLITALRPSDQGQ